MQDNRRSRQNLKRLFLIIGGTVLGLVCLYLAFRGVSWPDLILGVQQMEPFYMVPAFFLLMLVQMVRALRFGVIVSPFCTMGTKALWDLLNVWGAANMVMPARLAEFVRPYLLQRRGASFSSSLGAVMVERLFDLGGLLLLLAVVLWRTPEIDPALSYLGLAMLCVLVTGTALVLAILAKREAVQSVITRVLSLFPHRVAEFLGGVSKKLIDGFSIMASFRQAVIIFAYSILLWILFSSMTYVFLLAFGIRAPFLVAVTIQVLICLGVAVPSAPGFVGTFHAVCRYALALFGIQAVVAVSFATVYHLFSLIGCLMLGTASYLTSDFRFDRSLFEPPSDSGEAEPAGGIQPL